MTRRHFLIPALAALLSLPMSETAFAQACDATIASSEVGVTRIDGAQPRLFTFGNFHTDPDAAFTADRAGVLTDIAYVSTMLVEGRWRPVLSVLLSSGDGCFEAPTQPSTGFAAQVVGDEPSLIASGDLDDDGHLDIAIVDSKTDTLNPGSRLRIFKGDGGGRFAAAPGVSTFVLEPGQKQVAIAIGRFRAGSQGNDILLASRPVVSGALPRGKLTLLANTGSGEFTPAAPLALPDFEPEVMIASEQFRKVGKLDVLLRPESHSSDRRMLLLLNDGQGRFVDIRDVGNGIVASGRGNPVTLTGVIQDTDSAGDKHDIVVMADTLTLQPLINDGFGTFAPGSKLDLTHKFRLAGGGHPVAADMGDALLHVMAPVQRQTDGRLGVALIRNDLLRSAIDDDFAPEDFKVLRDIPPIGLEHAQTREQSAVAGTPSDGTEIKSLEIFTNFSGHVTNPVEGARTSDLILLARHVLRSTKPGPCGSPRHAAGRVPFPIVGVHLFPGSGISCSSGASDVCLDGLKVCTEPPVFNVCPCACAADPPPPEPAPAAACTTERILPPMLVVIPNRFSNR